MSEPATSKELSDTLPPTLEPAPGGGHDPRLVPTETAPSVPHFVRGLNDALPAGVRLGDFEIIAPLGAGAFATVYLARQVSLERQVALKVSANRGTEARTLASLEHEHIVRVFSETIEPQRDQRLLCMQFVNGTTLERILRYLAERPPASWSGQSILEAIDRLSTQPALFDPAALRDRELLGDAPFAEAVCWIGGRLAEALAHAHSQGVLHRDIKPANILLNRYGRPLLADFNIAADARPSADKPIFGGTLYYMAPEHVDAFNPAEAAGPEAVERRSDIYALGVVLYETLTGAVPFPDLPPPGPAAECLRQIAAERRARCPSPRQARPEVPEVLDRVVRRCLAPRPDDRFPDAGALARALGSCREQCRCARELPRGGWVTWAATRHPFAVGLALLLLPHVLGSIVNISYNALRIVDRLTPAQQTAFGQLVLAYNVVVYPCCVVLLLRLLAPIWRTWGRLERGEQVDPAELDLARRRALQVPAWVTGLSLAGWLPGGFLFPLGLHLLAGPCPPEVFRHFLLSATISGLIALTYSVFVTLYLVLRVVYPRLRMDATEPQREAALELRRIPRQLRLLQLLSGTIPLSGAILMVGVGPEEFQTGNPTAAQAGYQIFRMLVTALIALGMAGFFSAVSLTTRLERTLAALTGRADER